MNIDPSGNNYDMSSLGAASTINGIVSSISLPSYTFVTGTTVSVIFGALIVQEERFIWAMDESLDGTEKPKLTKAQVKEKSIERKKYKSRCTQPKPPNLTGVNCCVGC